MTFNWKTFRIDLSQFLSFLESNIPNSDGIYATTDYFKIMSKGEFSDEEIALIQSYYDSLLPEGE